MPVEKRSTGVWPAALLVLCLCGAGGGALAQDGEPGTLSIVLENDLFYNTDRHYTNGVRLSWVSAPEKVPGWVLGAARKFPLFAEGRRIRASYVLGQNMYTPSDITLPEPPEDDRPYAGWLYGSVGLIATSGRRLDQLELTVGMVGPASLAEETQKFVHDIVGADEPQGWATQLRNEPGVILTYQRSDRGFRSTNVGGLEIDLTPSIGGAVGNIFTYVNSGAMLRIGNHLPLDYGPPRIQPGLPGSGFFMGQKRLSWYLFVGVEGRIVARNIFLDGNTFRGSRSVDKKLFTGDLEFGAAVAWGRARLSYTHVLRTHEFKTQTQNDGFGAVSLSLSF